MEDENVEKQPKKQPKKQAVNKYDFIRNYSWVKGQSGNPNGRPKGKTLKEFAREYLASLPDDKKVEYLETLPAEIVWKMAEGNPETKTENNNTHTITTLSEEDKQRLNILL